MQTYKGYIYQHLQRGAKWFLKGIKILHPLGFSKAPLYYVQVYILLYKSLEMPHFHQEFLQYYWGLEKVNHEFMVPWLMDVQAAQHSIPKHGGSEFLTKWNIANMLPHNHVNVMECLVHNGIHPVSDPGVSFMSIMICYSSIYLLFLIRKHLYCRFYQHKCFSTGDGWWKKSWETVESTTLKGGTWRGLLQMFFLFKRVMFRFHITLW